MTKNAFPADPGAVNPNWKPRVESSNKLFEWFGFTPGKPTPGRYLLIGAVLLLLCTAGFALLPTVSNTYHTNCGSWIAKDPAQARLEDGKFNSKAAERNVQSAIYASMGQGRYSESSYTSAQEDSCMKAFGERTPTVLVLGIASVVVFAAGVVRRYQPAR